MLLVVSLVVALGMTTAAVSVWVTRHRVVPCPRCGAALAIDPEGRAVYRPPGTRVTRMIEAYRCAGCGGEYRQLERGPVISLETWSAGADFPQARIHRPR
jgi:DNA-directed RNA polymerase subunit RPC12/RpoP